MVDTGSKPDLPALELWREAMQSGDPTELLSALRKRPLAGKKQLRKRHVPQVLEAIERTEPFLIDEAKRFYEKRQGDDLKDLRSEAAITYLLVLLTKEMACYVGRAGQRAIRRKMARDPKAGVMAAFGIFLALASGAKETRFAVRQWLTLLFVLFGLSPSVVTWRRTLLARAPPVRFLRLNPSIQSNAPNFAA